MRTESEMLDLILTVAKADNRIRAVYMNGSRTNPNAPSDIFQDYDIVYVVTDVYSIVADGNWIDVFGERLMLQEPEKNDKAKGAAIDLGKNYGYLMLFTDGNRIDLHIQTVDYMLTTYHTDSLTIPLLDKDACLPEIAPSCDKGYWTKKPNAAEYFSTCNNFWWCMQNVAKGIWREELPYAKRMFEFVIRQELDQIVSWWIGLHNNFQVSPGNLGKYYEDFLPNRLWEKYRKTYTNANYENIWESVFVACDLFRILAMELAEGLSFDYIHEDDRNMMRYLERVRGLPKNAKGIF